jgi:hypothetical protein
MHAPFTILASLISSIGASAQASEFGSPHGFGVDTVDVQSKSKSGFKVVIVRLPCHDLGIGAL